jgi:hypothetical protein
MDTSINVGDDRTVWSTRSDPPDPIFAAIDVHREAYTAMEKAGADYDADPEEKEEGPLADRLREATGGEREVFRILLATKPRTRLRQRNCQTTIRKGAL